MQQQLMWGRPRLSVERSSTVLLVCRKNAAADSISVYIHPISGRERRSGLRSFSHKPEAANAAMFLRRPSQPAPAHDANSIAYLQRTLGNKAISRLVRAHEEDGKIKSASRLSAALAPSHEELRRELFGPPVVTAISLSASNTTQSSPSLPSIAGFEQDILKPNGNAANPPAPPASAPTPAAPAPAAPGPTAAPDACGQPLRMNKVVSGAFLHGLTMDSYYPDLSKAGFWAHGGSGGTFDTGRQAGGNTQLYGVILSPCDPSLFHFVQTATVTRYRVNGTIMADEGRTFDDTARSGRDYDHAPSRQDFLGGGTAPLGYVISMADPPSVNYSATRRDVERDTNFVTSLNGPTGAQSVSWSQSVHVAGGAVTKNTLT
jgi:hypothetical protein